jgi:hypothetical protein
MEGKERLHGESHTIPYSPFECALGEEEGFGKLEIDLWSIGIIFY